MIKPIEIVDILDYIRYVENEFGIFLKNKKNITIDKLERYLNSEEISLWFYPLDEIDYCLLNDIKVCLVRFSDNNFRLCEIF